MPGYTMENVSQSSFPETSQWFEPPESLISAAGGSAEIGQRFEDIFAQLDTDSADWVLSFLKECEQSQDCEGTETWEHLLSELQQQRSISQASSVRDRSLTPDPFLEDLEAGPESPPIPFGASLFTPTGSVFSFPTGKTFSQRDKAALVTIMESSAQEPDSAIQSNNKQCSKGQDIPQSDRNLRSYSRVLRSGDAKKRAQYLGKWSGI